MIDNIKPTDRIVVDLEMLQIDFNEQKKASLRKEIAKKYGLPLTNVDVHFTPITVNEFGDRISLASDIKDNVQDAGHQKDMMKHYIKIKEYTDIKWDEIDTIDNQVNAFVDFDQLFLYCEVLFNLINQVLKQMERGSSVSEQAAAIVDNIEEILDKTNHEMKKVEAGFVVVDKNPATTEAIECLEEKKPRLRMVVFLLLCHLYVPLLQRSPVYP